MKIITIFLAVVIFQLEAYQAVAQSESGMVLDKKTAFVGLLFSYTNTTKENTMSTFENIKFAKSSEASINTGGGYFFKKNFAVAFGFIYGSEHDNKESINALGPNTFTDQDLKTYTFFPVIRNYLSLGKKNSLYVFTQTGLQFGFGNGEEMTSTGSTTINSDIQKNYYRYCLYSWRSLDCRKGICFRNKCWCIGIQLFKGNKNNPKRTASCSKRNQC